MRPEARHAFRKKQRLEVEKLPQVQSNAEHIVVPTCRNTGLEHPATSCFGKKNDPLYTPYD